MIYTYIQIHIDIIYYIYYYFIYRHIIYIAIFDGLINLVRKSNKNPPIRDDGQSITSDGFDLDQELVGRAGGFCCGSLGTFLQGAKLVPSDI